MFDFDGTLLDSMSSVLHGLAAAVSPYRPRPDRDEVMRSLGGPSEACLRRLLGGSDHVADALSDYLRFLEVQEESIDLFDGAADLLRDLRSAGLPLAVWTGRERAMTVERLRTLHLEETFDAVVCGDDLDSHKPDPAGLLQILARWKLPRAAVLFAGDSDQDLEAARDAGMPMVAIRHGRTLDPARIGEATVVMETPPDAYRWIRGAILDSAAPAGSGG